MSKKEELLHNAAKIIYEEGIQKLTIDYLAKRSNLTKGDVLYHFKNKENLLLQMNKMAIQKFEDLLHQYMANLSGDFIFTRAYAYATLHFLKYPETALLPAVFISSLEDKQSFDLWKKVSNRWEQSFQGDRGDPEANLKLRMICDGIWFSLLYTSDDSLDQQIEEMVLNYCKDLEEARV